MSDSSSSVPFESTDAPGPSTPHVAILSFTATNSTGDSNAVALPGMPGTLQAEEGSKVTFTWSLSGTPGSLALAGAEVSLKPDATSYSATVQANTDFVLTVDEDLSETIRVFTHAPGEVVSQHAAVSLKDDDTPAYAIKSGSDIYVDPPVRLWAQYDSRWGGRTLGKTTPMPTTCKICGGQVETWHWHAASCNASSAAMVLRWWAEDCKATKGKYPFPSKDGSSLKKELYGPRMAQAFFPQGSPIWGEKDNPDGQVLLNSKSGGGVNFLAIFNAAAKSLGLDKCQFVYGDSIKTTDAWIEKLTDWLQYGPVILGCGVPAAHFVVLQGIVNGEFQIVDPGGVYWQFWRAKCNFSVRMPALDAWDPPIKKSDGQYDYRDYLSIKKDYVPELLKGMKHITSFTAPSGPKLGGKFVTSGTAPADVPEHKPAPADTPSDCSHCRGMQVAIDNNQCESRLKRGSHYSDAIVHYQWHLEEFGYDIGKTGADGDYGNATAHATGLFRAEIGQPGDNDCCDTTLAQAIVARHKANFKTGGASAAAAPASEPAAEPQPAAGDAADVEIEQFLTYFQYTAYNTKAQPTTYFVKARYNVDVDGAPNCYHSDKSREPKPKRYAYAQMDLEGTDPLDPQGDGGHPGNWFGVVTDTGEPTGNPIVQQGGKWDGFFISQTSLVQNGKAKTDPARYADSRYIPYWSIPVRILRGSGGGLNMISKNPTGRYGDYATAVNLRNMQASHAICADSGDQVDPKKNTASWGEGSFALAKAIGMLGGTDGKNDILWIIYPHSGAGQGTIPDAQTILSKGQQLFDAWGGMEMVKSVLAKMK